MHKRTRNNLESPEVPQTEEVYVSLAQASKAIGVTSHQLRRDCKDGMPHKKGSEQNSSVLIPLEAARIWLASREAKRHTVMNSSAIKRATREYTVEDEGIQGAYLRSCKDEQQAWKDYAHAIDKMRPINEQVLILKWHTETVKNLIRLEEQVLARDKVVREVHEQVKRHLGEWAQTIRMNLDAMPRALAGQVNPADPAVAEKALRTWLNTQHLPHLVKTLKELDDAG